MIGRRWLAVVCLGLSMSAVAADPAWRIAIEGQPALEGKNVIKTKLGKLTMLSMPNGKAMVTVNVSPDLESEPYSLQVGFTESQQMCMRGVGGQPTGEVTLTPDGERLLLGGSIKCRQLPDGEASSHPISGWIPAP